MITLNELNTNMARLFMSSELAEINWSSLGDSDKNVLIANAEDYFNSQQFDGDKVDEEQTDAFPRVVCGDTVEVNNNIRYALTLIVYDYLKYKTDSRVTDIEAGLKSKTLGKIKEDYDKETVVMVSDRWKKYVYQYLFRGVRRP